MKKVLFLVDDSRLPAMLEQDRDACGDNSYSLVVISSAKEAVEELVAGDVALFIIFFNFITELVFDFLDKIDGLAPAVPCVVISKNMNDDALRQLAMHGVFRVLDVERELHMLHQTVLDGIAAGEMGHISGVALPVALQMVELERKTCTLYVKSNDGSKEGVLYFSNGELLDAVTDDNRGFQAALEIVGWEGVEIDLQGLCKRRERVIQEPLTFILMEGARQKDETVSESENSDTGLPPGYEGVGTVSEFVPDSEVSSGEMGASFDDMDFARAPEPVDVDTILSDDGPLGTALGSVQTALARAIGPIAKSVLRSHVKDWSKEGEPSLDNIDQLLDLLCIEIEDEELIMEFRDELAGLMNK